MYKGLTMDELKTIFDSFNMYGLELLAPVVEAWQYEHEDDGEVLKEAFDSVYEEKEENQHNRERNFVDDQEGLKRTLRSLNNKEFEFVGELLELNPDDVFMHNPMESYCDEVIDEDYFDYFEENSELDEEEPFVILKGVFTDIEEERMINRVTNSNSGFNKRFIKSLKAPRIKNGFRPYSL